MRKKTLLLFIAALLLTGCAGKNNTSEQTTKSESPATDAVVETTTEAPTEAPTAIGHTDNNTSPFSMTYLGHASVKLVTKSGYVIYVDPYQSPADYSQPADLILVTHGHNDHNVVNLCTTKDNTQIITHKEALADGKYNKFSFDGVEIEAVPAANDNHRINECVGYIISFDGITIYHAGDTSKLNEMTLLKDRNIDIAMYPIDGKYNMDAKEASECAEIVGAPFNIPIHDYDLPSEPKKSLNFNATGKTVLEYGETIKLDSYTR